MAELVARLRKFCASGQHHFWPDSISLHDERVFDASLVRRHKQLTEVHLLGLAVEARRPPRNRSDRTVPLGT